MLTKVLAGIQLGQPLDVANTDSNSTNEAQDRNCLASPSESSKPTIETHKRKAKEIEYEVKVILQHRCVQEVIFDHYDI